jgi:formylglycine-generating enzyme required for sulfatase activity
MTIGCLLMPLLLIAVVVGGLLYVRSYTTHHFIVPKGEVVQVRAWPADTASLVARFGTGRRLDITGRTGDWRWLEVRLWDEQRGWVRRPLSILIWQLDAEPKRIDMPTAAPVPTPELSSMDEAMVAIPSASFTMGSPPGLGDNDEQPAHVVHLSAFDIDRTEVTVGQYWRCVEAGICEVPTRDASPAAPHYLNDPAFDHYPVINVPWTGANQYCRWRGKRLPTEAEWELAAGWDVERHAKLLWPWGNGEASGPVNTGDTASNGPAPVGRFPADRSPAGVLDMGGNVSEWVFDWYKVDYYQVSDATNPVGPMYRRGAGTGRVTRGGAFRDSLPEARASRRRHQAEAYGYPTVGFRCAKGHSD